MLEAGETAEKYEQYLAALNYSPHTRKAQRMYLKRFFVWLRLHGVEDMGRVTKQDLREYQVSLSATVNSKGEPNKATSQNHALKAIKGYFSFLVDEDYLACDPAAPLRYAKVPQVLPRSILTALEMRKLLEAPDPHTALGYRDRTVLELMYSTGLRKSEVGALVVDDLDLEGGYARVNSGKGSKDRVVPLGKAACQYLGNYLKGVRPYLVKDQADRHVFLSMRGGAFGADVVWKLVKRCAREAGITKPVSPHTLRHTCATLMLKNKANLRYVQELLGHARLDTTQVYTQVTIEDLKAVHKKCHPREREVDR